MGKSIYENELDHDSVVVWEAGVGHRVVFDSPASATIANDWLTKKSLEFHFSKEEQGTAVAEAYGDVVTPYELVRRFLAIHRRYGNKVLEGCLTRPVEEYW